MSLLNSLVAKARGVMGPKPLFLPNETASERQASSEIGYRTTPEEKTKYLYRLMWVDPDLRQAILDVREMDRLDGRVRRIHSRIARDTVKGGLVLQQARNSETLAGQWAEFSRRLQLNRIEKLKSDARGLAMEGNLPFQWVLDKDYNVVSGVRMASETILPNVSENGRFKDVTKAYIQFDIMTGTEIASFPLWQLFHARFDPDNFDDMGSLGRPFLDAARTTWRKLRMTEEDLVIRRRMRAPLRMAHVLKGATKDELDDYQKRVEASQAEGATTDYYMNRDGGVSAVQGDSNLDQVADIVHLLDTFFAGSPLPKGLMGYTDGMARDILEDIKRDYYDEIDVFQDTLSFVYEAGFRLQLLLKGINPDAEDFTLTFAERRTETLTQTTDRALKLKALGLPQGMVWEELGKDPAYVEKRRKWEAENYEPYPGQAGAEPATEPKVSITPGNGRKGESGTSISASQWLPDTESAESDAVKTLGEVARTLAEKPVPLPAQPQPVVVHVGIDNEQMNGIAQSLMDVAANTMQEIRKEIQDMPIVIPAPSVNIEPTVVHVAAPQVSVAAAQAPNVTVNNVVEPTPVTLEATLPPVQVNLPKRKTTTTVEKDRNGEITGSTAVEEDL